MKYVIVGNGVAGVNAAKELRKLDPQSDITIVGKEPFYCYSRPRLIELLGNEMDFTDITTYPGSWYHKYKLKVYLGTQVQYLDIDNQNVRTDSQVDISYDKLLLANGSSSKVPPISGIDHPDIFTFRNVKDVRQLQKAARHKTKCAVIGGGLLGLETAYNLSKLGLKVEVIDRNPWLLRRQIDERGGKLLSEKLADLGVYSIQEGVTDYIEEQNGELCLHLSDERKLHTDMIVVSAGIAPNTSLGEQVGLELNKGIVVNDYLQTSVSNIYAAGDIADYCGRSYGIIPAAYDQSKIAAYNMVYGNQQEYHGTIPTTSLKIAGIDFASLGEVHSEEQDQVVVDLDLNTKTYKKALFRDGCLKGAILLGDKSHFSKISKLMRSQEPMQEPEKIFES